MFLDLGSAEGGPLSLSLPLETPASPSAGPEPREEGALLEGINKG